MAGKLNARRVESLKEPGRHSDGNNLFLFISPNGAKRWTFLYRWNGGRREMGLGSASPGQVSLAEARNKALEARRLLNDGTDPLVARKALERAAIVIPTFGAFVEEYLKAHRPKFKNSKHAAQWEATLGANYCGSLLNKPINEIDTEAILKVLQPIWVKVPETASRLRGRLENVLDAAKVRGFYTNENPARWKGHLKAILPARQKLTRGHHAAMPYSDLPEFMCALRTKQALAALALELTILCASRTSETINATWAEIDFDKAVWTIPKERMKAGKEHRIPLSTAAFELVRRLHGVKLAHSPFLFPGAVRGTSLSNMAMAVLLKRMERTETVHGFRSSFRDWTAEQTTFSNETCEHALAHGITDAAEAAYRRGDQLEKRRALMQAWADYCGQVAVHNVVQLRKA